GLHAPQASSLVLRLQILQAREERLALGLVLGAHLEHADLARAVVVLRLALLGVDLGVLRDDPRLGRLVVRVLGDLAGRELGLAVGDRARADALADDITRSIAPLLDRRAGVLGAFGGRSWSLRRRRGLAAARDEREHEDKSLHFASVPSSSR